MSVQRTVDTRPPAFVSARRFPVRRSAAMMASSQQAVRRTLPPNLVRRDARCCALVRDDPRARRRHQGARFHTRAALPDPLARSARCPTRALLAPPCAGHAAALNAALCCVVRRSLTQVLRLVSEDAVSASRSAARAPGAPASAVRSAARCGSAASAIRTLVASGYRSAPETPAYTLGSK